MHKRKRILIISSCSKSKKIKNEIQIQCKSLITEKNRSKYLKELTHISLKASELYTGPQALAVTRAVKLLKHKHQVDYYIISAGFGLVCESTLLPPYECSFSDKNKSQIIIMASQLNINQDIQLKITQKYDMIYLALGKKYLTALGNLDYLLSLSSTIIIFDQKYEKSSSNIVYINDTYLVNRGKSVINKVFSLPLGASVASKGNLLENYSIDLKKKNLSIENLSFISWHKQKLEMILKLNNNLSPSSLSISTNKEKNSINDENIISPNDNEIQADNQKRYKAWLEQKSINSRGGFLLSVNAETKKLVNLAVKTVTDNDLKDLIDGCTGLKSINNRKGETRLEYVKKYEEHHDLYHKIVDIGNDLISSANEKTGDAKTKIKSEFVQGLRKRQELLKLSGPLLNEVKFGFMSSMVKWLNNPEELKKKSLYKPRNKDKKSKQSLSLNEPDIDIEMKSKNLNKNQWEIILSIKNKNRFPLQNVSLTFFDFEDEQLELSSVSGRNMEYNKSNKSVIIPYIQASMDDNEAFSTKCLIAAEKVENFNDRFKIVAEQDYPATHERILKEFTFN